MHKLLAVLLLLAAAVSAAEAGSICVAPVASRPVGKALELGQVSNRESYRFTIRISGHGEVTPSTSQSLHVGSLDLGKTRTIEIRNGGTPFASFSTRYPDSQHPDMCLWFSPMYQTWSLSSRTTRVGGCTCPRE
jgi:hypothetical protein